MFDCQMIPEVMIGFPHYYDRFHQNLTLYTKTANEIDEEEQAMESKSISCLIKDGSQLYEDT